MVIRTEGGRERQIETPSSRVRMIAWTILLNAIMLNVLLIGVTHAVQKTHAEIIPATSLNMTYRVLPRWLFGTDSMNPTFFAAHFIREHPGGSVYGAAFWGRRDKFQYPLAWLLPFLAAIHLGLSDALIFNVCHAIFVFALLGTVALGVLIARRVLAQSQTPLSTGDRRLLMISIVVGGIFFYPLTIAVWLGQAQVLLNFGFALGFYLWISGWEKATGALFGAMSMVKPQYGIFLLWAALRRKFGAFAACAAVLVIGLISSLAFFGLRANLEYLGVLSYLSHHGEIYFPNQSMGGLLNRALFNGNSFVFSRGTYPPYNPVVYWGTVVSSVILLVYGLMPPRNRTSSGGASDLACVMLIATMASPIAWEHHYGILFAILVWLAVRSLGRKPSRGEDLALLAAYCLTSNLLSIAGLTAHVPVLNLVQSYLYFGALLTLGLLVLAMRKGDLKWQRMH